MFGSFRMTAKSIKPFVYVLAWGRLAHHKPSLSDYLGVIDILAPTILC